MAADRIDDELLSAWLDDELHAVERQRVDAWLQAHPDDMARVRAWKADRAAVADLFRKVVDEPVPAALVATVWRRDAAHRWSLGSGWALAASVAGLLVTGALLGGGVVWRWQQDRQGVLEARLRTQLAAGTAQGWVQRAAFAHSVYVAEPRHAVEVKAQEEHLARWLTRRIDVPVKLFDLREQGFELVGGRLLPDGPGKSAQLMYQDAEKRRVTVYLRKPDDDPEAAFRFEQQGPLGMFYWVEAGAGYALVGELPKATLLRLAQAIYQQHPGALPEAPAVPASTAQPR